MSHASSHSAAPFESKPGVQVGNWELIQDCRNGDEEEFDSDNEESMMDWSLMPRENGAGRLEEDAWKRANGVRRILATDELAAMQSQPELLGAGVAAWNSRRPPRLYFHLPASRCASVICRQK